MGVGGDKGEEVVVPRPRALDVRLVLLGGHLHRLLLQRALRREQGLHVALLALGFQLRILQGRQKFNHGNLFLNFACTCRTLSIFIEDERKNRDHLGIHIEFCFVQCSGSESYHLQAKRVTKTLISTVF